MGATMAVMLAHVTDAPGTRRDRTDDRMGIEIPAHLRPSDGRFGCGPSKVRPEQVAALPLSATTFFGTSHRQAPVRGLVGQHQVGLWRTSSRCPTATRSSSATAGRPPSGTPRPSGSIDHRSEHLVVRRVLLEVRRGRRGGPAPRRSDRHRVPVGHAPARRRRRASTPTPSPTTRPRPGSRWRSPARRRAAAGRRGAASSGLVLVDATSAAGGLRVDPTSSTSTTSPRRRASHRTAASGWRCSRRPASTGSSGSRPRGAGCRPSST